MILLLVARTKLHLKKRIQRKGLPSRLPILNSTNCDKVWRPLFSPYKSMVMIYFFIKKTVFLKFFFVKWLKKSIGMGRLIRQT